MMTTLLSEARDLKTAPIKPLGSRLISGSPFNATALRSLILGLRLRGHISPGERELLDNLAPDGWITFLASRHGWVHPQDTELFPLDKLQCTCSQGGGAIFSQQTRSGADRFWRILSAAIADDQQAPLILGWCGPESETAADRMLPAYSSLIREARKSWGELDELVRELSTGLARSEPMLVVNRGSGRVITANETAARSLGTTRHQLTDSEFSTISIPVQRGSLRSRMSIRNLEAAGLNLALVTLSKPIASSDHNACVADFFTCRMRDKISHVLTAATLLESMSPERDGWPGASLIGDIIGEAESLNEYMRKASILIDHDRLGSENVSVVTALEESADLVGQSLNLAHAVSIISAVDGAVLRVPSAALVAMFEAVLLSHLVRHPLCTKTSVTVTRAEGSTGLELYFRTRTESAGVSLEAEFGWLDYADRLMARTGGGVINTQSESTALLTRLLFGSNLLRGVDHE